MKPYDIKKFLLRMKVVIGITIIVFALFLFREHWLMAIGNFLIVQDKLYPADVIHVIAGDDYRTNYAIQLYRQGYAKTIFFTGGWCTFHHYYHGLHGRDVALSQGVPIDAIAYDDSKVTSTFMEAGRLQEWISKSSIPINSVIVVSDPFHMRRASWAYKRVLSKEMKIEMAPVPFNASPFAKKWWKDNSSRSYVRDEYIKQIYYIIRYQYQLRIIQDWLVSLDRY